MARTGYIGIDLGTSGVKVVLIGEDQGILGMANAALTVSRPHSHWSEQAPEDWIRATRDALAGLARDQDLSGVRGIGLSGQMHGLVALDAEDQVLRPAILWNDTRAEAEARQLDADPIFRRLSGNIVFPGFSAPKLVWMKRYEPELHAEVRKVLLPKDYLRLWLTGEHVSEMSDAAGTSWLDTARRDWSDELLAATGASRATLPALVEGTEISGRLRDAIADEFGLPRGTPVAGGAGDNAATAIGAGTIAEGQGFVSLGTSGVIFVATNDYRPWPESAVHAFCHALPGMWHHMGVILQATAALDWLSRLTGQAPAALVGSLPAQIGAPREALFRPYLSGERTPHNSASLAAGLDQLRNGDDAASLTHAVLEGVAFALKDALGALHAAGSHPQALLALGGGARSRYWLELIATIFALPLELPADSDFGAAFGAARLGLMAAEGAAPAEVCTAPPIADVIEPKADLIAAYAEKHAIFRQRVERSI